MCYVHTGDVTGDASSICQRSMTQAVPLADVQVLSSYPVGLSPQCTEQLLQNAIISMLRKHVKHERIPVYICIALHTCSTYITPNIQT